MPLHVSLYFAFYIVFSFWSLADDVKKRKSTAWSLALETVSDVLLVIPALVYWLGPDTVGAEPLRAIYSVACCGLAFQMLQSIRKHALDQELSVQGRIFVGVSGTLLSLCFGGPLLYWGFKASVLHGYAGS